MRPVRHCQNLAGLRPHQNNRRLGGCVFTHGSVDFVFNDILQVKIDSQVDLIAVARGALLSPIEHDFLAGAIMLDVTVAVLPVQIFFHRRFHALDAVMFEIGESDHMTEHGTIWINPRGVVFQIDAAQILAAQFFAQRIGHYLRHLAFDHDVTAITV